jgi:hypothetical protein
MATNPCFLGVHIMPTEAEQCIQLGTDFHFFDLLGMLCFTFTLRSLLPSLSTLSGLVFRGTALPYLGYYFAPNNRPPILVESIQTDSTAELLQKVHEILNCARRYKFLQ